jgi:hypothetical protein
MDRALLVGINKYPGCPLYGYVNDITDMANFLKDTCMRLCHEQHSSSHRCAGHQNSHC